MHVRPLPPQCSLTNTPPDGSRLTWPVAPLLMSAALSSPLQLQAREVPTAPAHGCLLALCLRAAATPPRKACLRRPTAVSAVHAMGDQSMPFLAKSFLIAKLGNTASARQNEFPLVFDGTLVRSGKVSSTNAL